MKIFYYCNWGVHSSLVAAGIHLGLLPRDRKPRPREILDLPGFDMVRQETWGRPLLVGTDKRGNQVYTFPVGNEEFLAPKSIRSMLDVFKRPQDQVLLVDALKYTTPWMKVGGYLSLVLGLQNIGRWVVVREIIRNYSNLVAQVERVLEELDYG